MRQALLVITAAAMLAAGCGDAATTTPAPPATTTTLPPTTTTLPPTTTTTSTLAAPALLDHVSFDGDDWRLAYACTEPGQAGTKYFGPFDEVMGGVGFELENGRVTSFELEFVRFAFDGTVDTLTVVETPTTVTIAGQVIPRSDEFGDEPLEVALTIDLTASFPCLQLRSDGLGSVDFGDDPDDVVEILTRRMGEPLDDSGWFDAEICIGTVLRTVRFRATYVYFTDGETPYAPEGTRHFAGWEMQHPAWASDEAGIRPGSTFEELEAAYGPLDFEFSVPYERWEAIIPDDILVVVDVPEPGGAVVTMEAGPFLCGE